MSVSIISRATWGAKPWDNNPKSKGPATVPLGDRTEFFVHWDGPAPITRTGYAIPRAIEAEHFGNGWSGIGYNFVVDQAGNIYEGRGWTRQGAHCPGHNVSGIGVQVAIGKGQKPSAAALAACRALYDEACRKTGRTLAKRGHKDGYATECPGPDLYKWVHDGMPAGAPAPSKPTTPSKPKPTAPAFPGPDKFGPGKSNKYVTMLGERLVAKGYRRFYEVGPGPRWTDADRNATRAFQKAQGWTGSDADGYPGPETWRRLFA